MNKREMPSRRSLLRLIGLLLGCLLVGAAGGWAQSSSEEKPVPPTPLFQKKIPEGKQCTVEIKYPALEKALSEGRKIIIAPYAVEKTLVAEPKLSGMEIKLSDKRIQRKYRRAGYLLGWDSKLGISFESATGENTQDFRDFFSELDWVDGRYFVGEVTVDGAKYLAYNDGDRKQRLLIDPETLLPIRYESPGFIYRYTYGHISRDLTDLPPDLAKEWQRISGGDKQP